MRCRIPTSAPSGGAAQCSPSDAGDSSAPPRQQQADALSAAAAPAGLLSPFASPRALPEPGVPAEWDELVGDTADGELEDLVSQMMLSSTLRLFDGGADAATGVRQGHGQHEDQGLVGLMPVFVGGRCKPEILVSDPDPAN